MNKKSKGKFIFVQSLTLGRIPLILIFLVISIFAPKPMTSLWFLAAFVPMILSAVTDLFDGYYARKFDVVTRLGAYADPLTDKIFYLTTFPTLIYLAGLKNQEEHTLILLSLTILFMMRDQWVSFLRSIGAIYHIDAKANWSGKVRTLISFPMICTIFYYLEAPQSWFLQCWGGWWPPVYKYLIYTSEMVGITINFISIWVYTRYYWPWIKLEMKTPFEDSQETNSSDETK